jgi:hypothetical protein
MAWGSPFSVRSGSQIHMPLPTGRAPRRTAAAGSGRATAVDRDPRPAGRAEAAAAGLSVAAAAGPTAAGPMASSATGWPDAVRSTTSAASGLGSAAAAVTPSTIKAAVVASRPLTRASRLAAGILATTTSARALARRSVSRSMAPNAATVRATRRSTRSRVGTALVKGVAAWSDIAFVRAEEPMPARGHGRRCPLAPCWSRSSPPRAAGPSQCTAIRNRICALWSSYTRS